MSRTGTPMYQPRMVCKVFVTIDYYDGRHDVRLWRGKNKESIKVAARKFYPASAQLQFGNRFYCIL